MADTYLSIPGESTIATYLGWSSTSTGDKTWMPILTGPEIFGAPEQIDVTDMSNRVSRSIPGVQQLSAMEFTANFDDDAFDTLLDLQGSNLYLYYYFGDSAEGTPDGHLGKFTWQGSIDVRMGATSSNSRKEMTITSMAKSKPEFTAGS